MICLVFPQHKENSNERRDRRQGVLVYDFVFQHARKKWRQDGENKNIKTRPISASNRNGVLLCFPRCRAASARARSSSFNFHYHGLFSDLICCLVRSMYIGSFCCLMQSYFFPSTECSTHIGNWKYRPFCELYITFYRNGWTTFAIFAFSAFQFRRIAKVEETNSILIIFEFQKIITHASCIAILLRYFRMRLIINIVKIRELNGINGFSSVTSRRTIFRRTFNFQCRTVKEPPSRGMY